MGPETEHPGTAGMRSTGAETVRNPMWLRSPVIIASGLFGTDGYGQDTGDEDLRRVGAVVLKTATLPPRSGNPHPRVWHHPGGIYTLNSVGLQNPGLQKVLEDLPRLPDGCRTVLSIGGASPQEFGALADIARGADVFALELNLSCPNQAGYSTCAHGPELARLAVGAARKHWDLRLWAKLAPDVPDIGPLARAAEDAGADALTICNTMPAAALDPRTGKSRLGTETGGMSGPALGPVALRLVRQAAASVKITVIGAGGIRTPEDAREFLLAGAGAVQVGTAELRQPGTAGQIAGTLRSE